MPSLDVFMKDAPLFFVASVFVCFIASFLYAFIERAKAKPFLDRSSQQLRLIDRIPITHDTLRLRFELPSRAFCIGLPPGKHIKIFGPNRKGAKEGQWNGIEDREHGKDVIERKYTPVTGDEFPGFVDFVIKVYKGGVSERFVDGGKMSQYLNSIVLGDCIDVMGPIGLLTYHGNGKITKGKKEMNKKRIGMVAGGTGITPMLQILRHIFNKRGDPTEVWLLFANQSEEDILMRETLEEFASHHSEQFHLWYTVDRVTPACVKWNYSTGFVNEEMMMNHLPPPSDDSVILLCGPPPMIKYACYPNLEKIGWPSSDILEF